jgi:hypothetical protein
VDFGVLSEIKDPHSYWEKFKERLKRKEMKP